MQNYQKAFGALLLLVSLALPMSSCSHYEDAEGNRVSVPEDQSPPEGIREVVSYNYALDPFDAVDVPVFFWPAVAVAICAWRKRGRVVVVVRVLEPFLLAGSFYAIEFQSTFFVDQRGSGAYLAFLALGIYAVAAAWADIEVYRGWRKNSRPSS